MGNKRREWWEIGWEKCEGVEGGRVQDRGEERKREGRDRHTQRFFPHLGWGNPGGGPMGRFTSLTSASATGEAMASARGSAAVPGEATASRFSCT